MSRGPRLLIVAVAGLGLAGLAAWAVRPPPVPPPDRPPDYDLSARPPERIAPGTVVDAAAPPGWSHLVIKSLPRVRKDQEAVVRKVAIDPPRVLALGSWMFTAFAADVRADGGHGHRLRAVGLGLGTAVDGRDTVLTPETAAAHGVRLDWLTTRQILTKGYEVQDRAVMAVHGPTFGLLDTPVVVHRGGANRTVRYRYALLVDRPTGRLDVLLWLLDGEPEAAVRIAAGTVDAAELVPDPRQFNAVGIPNELGFGVEALPPHAARHPLPPALRPLAARTRFTPADARALEAGLRQLPAP